MAAVFLIVALWNITGLCAGLGVLIEHRLSRPADLRAAAVLLVLGFTAIAMRGQSFEILSWPLGLLVAYLTIRFVRRCAGRARTRRLLGRAVPHT